LIEKTARRDKNINEKYEKSEVRLKINHESASTWLDGTIVPKSVDEADVEAKRLRALDRTRGAR
jgi:hypothetical protein